MLNITPFRSATSSKPARPAVAIVANRDRRAIVKHMLRGHADIVGELESGARMHLLLAVEPDVIFIDTLSPAINPVAACRSLISAGSTARIVLLVDEPTVKAITGAVNGVPAVNPLDVLSALATGGPENPQPVSGHSPVAA
jgi:DNA-binding NarL/FixJ family response regulator